MSKAFNRIISVFPSNANYSWLFYNALRGLRDTHFDTVTEASQANLAQILPKPQAVIVDKKILTGSNGDGTKLLQSCHALGLLVITVADDTNGFIAEGDVARSSLHLRLNNR